MKVIQVIHGYPMRYDAGSEGVLPLHARAHSGLVALTPPHPSPKGISANPG